MTVATQPTSPSQTCTVANPTGTVGSANVTNVNVTCTTNTFTVGGVVNGLTGAGLRLRNGADSLDVTANGGAPVLFTFSSRVPSGQTYDVRVQLDPVGQTCTVSGGDDGSGGGTIGNSNVTSVVVTCVP